METLEKIPYVISVYFPVLFFLLAGLGLAWWLWYKHASRLNQVLSQNERLNKELSGLLRATPSAGSKGKSQGAAKSTTASDKVKAPSKEASKPQGNKTEKAKAPVKAEAAASEKKSDAVAKDNKWSKANSASAYKPSEKALESYKGEDIKVDDDLGVLFNSRPKEVDDLKKVNGVGKVLEGKLQEIGIYRFRQIANWDKSLMAEFSNRLAFPGRVERDEWKKQAIALHKEKYGESL